MRSMIIAALLGMAVPAFAGEQAKPATQPTTQAQRLTDEQLDNVAAGDLISVGGVNVTALNNVSANVPVNVGAAVNANILGNATQGSAATATLMNPVSAFGATL